jgi:hypothetical protein
MKKALYITTISVFFAVVAKAQTEKKDTLFTRDVNIVRAYTPVIKDAGKINSQPAVEESEMKKSEVNYATWSSPLTTDFDLQTLPSATLKKMTEQKELREGYATIGAGNYTSFLGNLYVPILRKEDYRLDFSLQHLSTFGKVKLDDKSNVKAENMTNSAQLSFNKNFIKVDLFSEFNFNRNDFNYYGLDSLKANNLYTLPSGKTVKGSDLILDKDAHTFVDFKLGIVSRPKIGGIDYAISTKYALTSTSSDLNESHITTEGYVKTGSKVDEFGLNMGLDNLFYNKPDTTAALFKNVTDELDSYAVFRLAPYYQLKDENWDVKFGFKTFYSFNKGKPACASPDITGKIALIPELFYLYGGLTGDLKINSMQSIFMENQYFRPDGHVSDTYTPIDAYAGLKVKIFDGLVFNGFIGYKYINNQYFFVNHTIASATYDNTFNVVYDEVGLFNTGGSLTYNWDKKLNILLKGTYDKYSLDKLTYAWQTPEWKINLDASYKINEDVTVSLNALALGKRYAFNDNNAISLDPVFDLSLNGVYEYNSWVSIFLKLNNLLAQNYQTWYGYNTHLFNAMAGVTISF